MEIIITFVSLLTTVLTFAIFGRAILTWFPAAAQGNNPFVALLYQITEPMLAPLRAVIPRVGMMDLSPMVAIFILFAIRRVIESL